MCELKIFLYFLSTLSLWRRQPNSDSRIESRADSEARPLVLGPLRKDFSPDAKQDRVNKPAGRSQACLLRLRMLDCERSIDGIKIKD